MQERKLAHTNSPPQWNDVVRDAYILVQEGNLAHTSFYPWWDNVQDALVLVQEEKLARASFPP
jgi:hypothetical protein